MGSLHTLQRLLHSVIQYAWYPLATAFELASRGLDLLPSLSSNSPSPGLQPEPQAPQSDLPTHPPNVEVIYTRCYLPPRVTKILTRGGGNFIGFINDTTVLKYPCIPGDLESLKVEAQLLEAVGQHPRIIPSHGLTDHGLVLAYARNGNLSDHIQSNPSVPLYQRLDWCRQAGEAVEYIHRKNVIHCDSNLRNFLLDENLDLLLADFQGMLKAADGTTTLLDGLSRESSKSSAPRPHGDYADRKTDLFALGSAIHFIILGAEIFPDIDSNNEKDDDEIAARFQRKQFPTDDHVCAQITAKCWNQLYKSAGDLLFDIVQIQQSVSR